MDPQRKALNLLIINFRCYFSQQFVIEVAHEQTSSKLPASICIVTKALDMLNQQSLVSGHFISCNDC